MSYQTCSHGGHGAAKFSPLIAIDADEFNLPDGHRATDVGNAERLLELARGRLRYVHAWGKVARLAAWPMDLDENDALVTEQGKLVSRALFALAAKADSKDERKDLWTWALRVGVVRVHRSHGPARPRHRRCPGCA